MWLDGWLVSARGDVFIGSGVDWIFGSLVVLYWLERVHEKHCVFVGLCWRYSSGGCMELLSGAFVYKVGFTCWVGI